MAHAVGTNHTLGTRFVGRLATPSRPPTQALTVRFTRYPVPGTPLDPVSGRAFPATDGEKWINLANFSLLRRGAMTLCRGRRKGGTHLQHCAWTNDTVVKVVPRKIERDYIVFTLTRPELTYGVI